MALPSHREILEEVEETVGAVPTKADPRTEQGIPRRQPQRIVSKEEWQGPADLRGTHGLDDNIMREIVERSVIQTESGKPERLNLTKYYEEILEAKKQKEQEPPSSFKQKLGLSDEQDDILKQMRQDKIKLENRGKLMALMQLLEEEDKKEVPKPIGPVYVDELKKRGVEVVDEGTQNLEALLQMIRSEDKAESKA